MIGIIKGLQDQINKLEPSGSSIAEYENGYERAISDVQDVIADYFSSNIELANWSLRDEGLDPEKVVADGLAFIAKLKNEPEIPSYIHYAREWAETKKGKNPVMFYWSNQVFMKAEKWLWVNNGAKYTPQVEEILAELNRLFA